MQITKTKTIRNNSQTRQLTILWNFVDVVDMEIVAAQQQQQKSKTTTKNQPKKNKQINNSHDALVWRLFNLSAWPVSSFIWSTLTELFIASNKRCSLRVVTFSQRLIALLFSWPIHMCRAIQILAVVEYTSIIWWTLTENHSFDEIVEAIKTPQTPQQSCRFKPF